MSNYVQFFNLMVAVLIFFTQMGSYFIFEFLCLTNSDSDRISTLEPFVSKKMGYYTVSVSHFRFLRPASL